MSTFENSLENSSALKYLRPEILAMAGYTPGEQPKIQGLIKLNTNENPYPPSPAVYKLLKEDFDPSLLKLYPDPVASELCKELGESVGIGVENVIAGNGSDDILTMAFRCFCDKDRPVACVYPTYSLYTVLAGLQNAECIQVDLNSDFSLPENLLEKIEKANLFVIPNPNAPTSNLFDSKTLEKICASFKGIVMIDEAYADFSGQTSANLVKKYPNVIVSRTFSKSYSLAGARFGYAMAQASLIYNMMKMKDSYNVNMMTQKVALASFRDKEYLRKTVSLIIETREKLGAELSSLGFKVEKSSANFLFAAPPDRDGARCANLLRDEKIIVRYFPGRMTGEYVRITIGTPEQTATLIAVCRKIYG